MENYFVITMVILLSSCAATKSIDNYKQPYLALDITQNDVGEYVYCGLCPEPTLKVLDVEVNHTSKISSRTTRSQASHILKGTKNTAGNADKSQLPKPSFNVSTALVQAKPEQSSKAAGQIKTVFFEMDSSTLSQKDKFFLSKIQFDENLTIEIKGYTDAYGSDAYNLKLSERRALSVYQILKINNPSIKFHLLSKGKCCYLTRSPFDPTNRRVEVVIHKKSSEE